MSRLIAFGCSYTYGHGLADCHIEPNMPGLNPSNLAWPSILGNLLNREVVNCGNPGASNLHILWKLLNFNFTQDDICVIMWTHFGRLPFSNLKYNHLQIEWDEYETDVVKRLPELEKENIVIKNCIAMHHGYSYLESKNIKHLMVIAPPDANLYRFPLINIPTLNREITIKKYQTDVALDNMHPGPNTHRTIAKEIYNKINVIH